MYSCDSNDDYESFFHFYFKGKRYTQEIYFSGIEDRFSFVHMNKDKHLDIIYENISVSGQGWWVSNIFLLEPKSKKYILKNVLSSPAI